VFVLVFVVVVSLWLCTKSFGVLHKPQSNNEIERRTPNDAATGSKSAGPAHWHMSV
jgi:hypothetical protein